jgi:hypothetical protein
MEAEVVDSEREFLESGGVMPADVDAALRSFHARLRMANGMVTTYAKTLSADYDDQKTPARTPSAMIRAASPEAIQAFEKSVELMQKKP